MVSRGRISECLTRSLGLLVSVALVAALAAPADATSPGQNGKIAFTGVGPDGYEINTINPDGTGRSSLAVAGPQDQMPNWSPDGRRFFFFQSNPTGHAQRLANADGSGVQSLFFISFGSSKSKPDWAADGQRLTYAYASDATSCAGGFQIRSANLDGTGSRQLTALPSENAVSPAWSPDGTKIAFAAESGDNPYPINRCLWSDIYVMNSDGSGEHSITGSFSYETNPDWSPDSTKIVYDDSSPDGSAGQIYSMNADGSGKTPLTSFDSTILDTKPSWSPDGTKIAFARSVSGANRDIYVMNADGSAVTNVTNTSADERDPDWQPIPPQPDPPTTYDHPRFASPLKVSLVPNYRQTISATQCQARGGTPSTHGAPLSLDSCNPPGFASGTQAHIGRDPSQAPPAQSSSWASYAVIYGDTNAANGDQADMTLHASLNDIHNAGGSDYSAAAPGADLTLVTRVRISDRLNGPSQSDPATVQDFDYQTPIDCTSTAGPEGASCSLDTSADAITPNTVRENKGTVVQVFRFRVNDSGVNGTPGDADDRTFATQGIYVR